MNLLVQNNEREEEKTRDLSSYIYLPEEEGKAGWKKYKHYNVSSFNGLYTNIHSVDMFTTRAVDVIKQHYEKYLIAKGKDDDTYVPLFLQLTHQVPHTPVDM